MMIEMGEEQFMKLALKEAEKPTQKEKFLLEQLLS